MRYLCAVAHCTYIAESSIDDFDVCGLHDAPHVRRILEQLKLPGAFGKDNRPIVVPVGDLAEEHLARRPAFDGAIYAIDCPWLARCETAPSSKIYPYYDLTRDLTDLEI